MVPTYKGPVALTREEFYRPCRELRFTPPLPYEKLAPEDRALMLSVARDFREDEKKAALETGRPR